MMWALLILVGVIVVIGAKRIVGGWHSHERLVGLRGRRGHR